MYSPRWTKISFSRSIIIAVRKKKKKNKKLNEKHQQMNRIVISSIFFVKFVLYKFKSSCISFLILLLPNRPNHHLACLEYAFPYLEQLITFRLDIFLENLAIFEFFNDVN